MVSELYVGIEYRYDYFTTLVVDYILIKCQGVWLWVREIRQSGVCRYLSRLTPEQVSVIEGVLYIEGDDLLITLQGGYTLGTLYRPKKPKTKGYAKKKTCVNT